ncbi:MAG TPA: DUF6232 family protein [Opitutales bacterium]|jgi:hypothetical protein|nr:DUF6232 family protein [Opitutales bacterium]
MILSEIAEIMAANGLSDTWRVLVDNESEPRDEVLTLKEVGNLIGKDGTTDGGWGIKIRHTNDLNDEEVPWIPVTWIKKESTPPINKPLFHNKIFMLFNGRRKGQDVLVTNKIVVSNGRTIVLSSIASVRRKTKWRKRPFGIVLIIFGVLFMWGSVHDEMAVENNSLYEDRIRVSEAANEVSRYEYGTAAYNMAVKNLDSIKATDITEDLEDYDMGFDIGFSMVCLGLLYIFARSRTNYIMVSTGGKEQSIFHTIDREYADSIVANIGTAIAKQ